MRSAEEYVWVLTDQAMSVHNNVMIDQVAKGIKFRSLIHERMLNSTQIRVSGKAVERRLLSSIPALVVKTDKEAFFSLLALDGTLQHSGFFGGDKQFMVWVEDFYMYFGNGPHHSYPK